MLEDIPRIQRPRTLQYLMRTKTYLEWPADKPAKVKNGKIKFQDQSALDERRKIFWRRMIEAIKEKKWKARETKQILTRATDCVMFYFLGFKTNENQF